MVEGIVRAKIDRVGKVPGWPVLPILMHGDASFSGQGVVYETLQMSQLRAYKTGGTHPPGRQQPGRLHHRADRVALVHLLHGRGQGHPGAGVPRQRRRPRGRRPGGAGGVRLPAALRQGRRRRPGLLPPPRPQRGRRPELHPAADVRPDRAEAQRPQALHRGADRTRRHLRRGRRAGHGALPRPAGERVPRGARGRRRGRRVLPQGPLLPGEAGQGAGHRDHGRADGGRRQGPPAPSPRASRCTRRCCPSSSVARTRSAPDPSTGRRRNCWPSARC